MTRPDQRAPTPVKVFKRDVKFPGSCESMVWNYPSASTVEKRFLNPIATFPLRLLQEPPLIETFSARGFIRWKFAEGRFDFAGGVDRGQRALAGARVENEARPRTQPCFRVNRFAWAMRAVNGSISMSVTLNVCPPRAKSLKLSSTIRNYQAQRGCRRIQRDQSKADP